MRRAVRSASPSNLPSSRWKLTVSDNGVGAPDENVRVGRSKSGLGLEHRQCDCAAIGRFGECLDGTRRHNRIRDPPDLRGRPACRWAAAVAKAGRVSPRPQRKFKLRLRQSRPETATPELHAPASKVVFGSRQAGLSPPRSNGGAPPSQLARRRPSLSRRIRSTPWGTGRLRSGRRQRSECAS